jgi:uncharacterized protein YndB with AHSA1/START domain
MKTVTDKIEKQIVLKASRSRVWRALTTASEFGEWFGVKLEGDFKAGHPIHGKLAGPTECTAEFDYKAITFELVVDRIEPEDLFSYRWHPYAIDPKVDYSSEPTTLVAFRLEAVGDKETKLTVTETGFDALPAERRDICLRMNSNGWGKQLDNVREYVER